MNFSKSVQGGFEKSKVSKSLAEALMQFGDSQVFSAESFWRIITQLGWFVLTGDE